MLAKTEVSSEGLTGKGYVSNLIHAAVGRIQFFAAYWPENSLSFLSRGPLHKAAYTMAASCPPLEQVRENIKRVPKMEAKSFCNILSEVTSHPICHILFPIS